MKTKKRKPTLEDVLNEFVEAYEKPTAEAIESWTIRYPEFRRELVDFAAAWAEQLVLPPGPGLSAEQEKLLVDRAMSHVQNLTFRREQGEPAQVEHQTINSLISEAKRVGMNGSEFATACGLDIALLTKLNNRLIKPASIPTRLIKHIASLVKKTFETVEEYFAQPPQSLNNMAFLARGKPKRTEQQSFDDALRGSSLSETEKARWLEEV